MDFFGFDVLRKEIVNEKADFVFKFPVYNFIVNLVSDFDIFSKIQKTASHCKRL